MTTLLLDADTLVYRYAGGAQQIVEWSPGVFTSHARLEPAWEQIVGEIERLKRELGAGEVRYALSDPGDSFRKAVYPMYKSRRWIVGRPILWGAIRERFLALGAEWHQGLEGDDVLGLWATDPAVGGVVVSIDKDMRTVPGSHFNPDQPDAGVREISLAEADRNLFRQALAGDRVDGYPGLPGVGPVKAARILGDATDPKELWRRVLKAYVAEGQTFGQARSQVICARILRHGEYADGRVRLWKAPMLALNEEQPA